MYSWKNCPFLFNLIYKQLLFLNLNVNIDFILVFRSPLCLMYFMEKRQK